VSIKYEHALGEDNTAINIQDVSEGDRSKVFSCLGCGNQLIPVLGNIVERHFRHKAELSCSGETYLHRLAKIKFHSAFVNALAEKKPFLVEIPRTNQCDFYLEKLGSSCTTRTTKQFDLTAHFSEPPLLESRWENFIPDVLLQTEKGVPLFIEIKVSHGCSEEKINSGHRIIEITVDSADTIDFESVLREGRKVKLYNFKSSLEKVDCSGRCFRGTPLGYESQSLQRTLEKIADWRVRLDTPFHGVISLEDIDNYKQYVAEEEIRVRIRTENILEESRKRKLENQVISRAEMDDPDYYENFDRNFPQIGDRVEFLQIPREGDPVLHQGSIGLNNGHELAIDVTTGGRFFCPRRDWQSRIRFIDRPDPDFNKDYYLN